MDKSSKERFDGLTLLSASERNYPTRPEEARLEAFLERLAARIGALPESREVAAVLLGGGYGRGEGGVFRKPDGDAELFNDLDFFVISRPLPRRRRKALDCAMREFGKGFDEEIGVDVDFGPARSAGELEHMPYTLMWQELRAGCRRVWGDPRVWSAGG